MPIREPRPSVSPGAGGAPPAEAAPLRGASRWRAALFAAGLVLYAVTRLADLTRFPIYFFCDEAVQANVAGRFARNGFRDDGGVLLPGYFLNDQRRAMSLNIYLLAPPITLLGKTVSVTRGTFVAVSLLGAAALGIALRAAGLGMWWTGPYLLALLPVDFLHSRLALETTPGFTAMFVAAYVLYRLRSGRWLPAVILAGAATFYSYTAGQGIVVVAGLVLLLVDARYHFAQPRRRLAVAALLLLVAAFPFVREHVAHPSSTRDQLLVLHSYWIAPMPLSEKLATFAREYAYGFDPRYWFRPDSGELIRHRMDGMAYVPPALAPLIAIGIGASLLRFRHSPAHRVFLITALAVPFAAAVDRRQVLRVLPMIVPIVLLAAAGLEELVRFVRRPAPRRALAVGLAAVLAVGSIRLAVVSLNEGPLWFDDYGLYGMQYGARQIFDGIRDVLQREPRTRVLLTSSWANNPDEFLDFFLDGAERRRAGMGGIETYRLRREPLSPDQLFVVTAAERAKAREDPKLVVGRPERTILYPDGRPGFFFVRLSYSPEADAIFAAEREERRRPRETIVDVDGRRMRVRYSMTDMGTVPELFDGRVDSTLRGFEANPFVLDFEFEKTEALDGLSILIGRMECEITVEVTPAAGGPPLLLRREIRGLSADSDEKFRFSGGAVRAKKVRVAIHESFVGEPAHIELREVRFGWAS